MPAIGHKARLAVLWTTGLSVLRDAVQFVLMLVVVRIMPAEAYGQFGLVNTIVGFMMVFSSREFIAHTLLVRDDAEVNYQDQFTAGCAIQSVLFVLGNALAFGARYVPSYAPVAPLLHVMSIAFLLDLPSELRWKMLERRMDWQRLRTVEAIGIVASALMTLGLALAHMGAYALLIPSFAIPICFAVDLFLVERWRPTFEWHAGRYRSSGEFGARRILSVSFVSGSNLLESSTIARAAGYTVLGIFGRAMGMATLFCQRVASLLMSALYPVLARIPKSSPAYQKASALVLRTVVWTVMPVATGVSLLRSDIVTTLYGDRWTTVVPLVPAAMAVGAVMAAVQAAYSLLLANENARQCLYADLWRLIGMGAGVFLVLPFGVQAYLGSLVVVHAVALALVLGFLMQANGVTLGGIASAVLPAAAAVGLSVVTGETTRALLLTTWPAIPRMVVYIPTFAATYMLTLRFVFPALLHDVVSYLPVSGRMHRLLGYAAAA